MTSGPMLPSFRLLTLHPALVHVPVGAAAVLLVVYAFAWRARSAQWTFAGDGVLLVAAPFAVIAFASGLLSNALAPWPGGVGRFRVAHLALGAATTVLFLGLGGLRLARRRRQPVIGLGTLALTAGLAVVVAATGWVGGEVLVFHAGIAVRAAGEGALSPRLGDHAPTSLPDAMGQLRGAWGDAQVSFAAMVVQRPSEARFGRIADDAARLVDLARALSSRPRLHGRFGADDVASLQFMADRLADSAQGLADAAKRRSAPAVARSLASVSSACAGCHLQLRYGPDKPPSSPSQDRSRP